MQNGDSIADDEECARKASFIFRHTDKAQFPVLGCMLTGVPASVHPAAKDPDYT